MTITTVVRIRGNLIWQIAPTKTGGWLAVCDPLKLTIESEVFSELMEDISLTLDAIFKDLLVSNELPRFFQEHGWHGIGQIPHGPENVKFDMPFFTAMMGSRDSQANLYQ